MSWARNVLVLATAVILRPRASRPEAVDLSTLAAAKVAEFIAAGRSTFTQESTVGSTTPEPPSLSDAKGGIAYEETGIVPPFLRWTIATVFVVFVSVGPFLNVSIRDVNRIHVAEAVLVSTVNLGTLVMFTSWIFFESDHWEGEKHLTLIEALYLMAQVITTIGYGDIYPARKFGRMFLAFYIFFCVFVMAELLVQIAKGAASRMTAFRERLERDEPGDPAVSRARWLGINVPTLPWARFQVTALLVVTIAGVGICFFMFWPGEERSFINAGWMQLMSMSTVGFGVFTPHTEIGFLFQSLFMPIGVLCFALVIDAAAELVTAAKLALNHNLSVEVARVKSLAFSEACNQKAECDDQMNSYQFLRFVLVNRKIVSQADLDDIEATFAQLRPSDAGMVPMSKIIETIERTAEDAENAGAHSLPIRLLKRGLATA